MTKRTDVYDPRSEIDHTIEPGNVYEDSRTDDELTLVYVNDEVVLLRDEDSNHRLNKRRAFETIAGSGRYRFTGETEPITSRHTFDSRERIEVPFEDVSGIGAKTADALRASGFVMIGDIERAEREELMDVDGMGASNTSNLLEYVEEEIDE